MPSKPAASHYLSLVGACAAWGLSFVVTKFTLESMGAMTLVLGRFAIGAVILGAISPALRFQKIEKSDLKFFFLLCTFEPGLYYIFETYGIQKTDPTSAALIIAAIPVLVIIIAHFTAGERLTPSKIAGAAVSIAGVFVVTTGGVASMGAGTTLAGNLLVMGATVVASFFTVVLSRLAKRYNPVTVTRFQVLFASLFFLPLGVPEYVGQGCPVPDAWHLAALLFLALVPGLGAFFMYNHALSAIEAGRAAVFLNLIPVFTATAAWLFLRQEFTLFHLAGGALTVGGVLLANRGRGRDRKG